jgi:hypothetical protein
VDPRAGLGSIKERTSLIATRTRTPTVQPVASRYTDSVVPPCEVENGIFSDPLNLNWDCTSWEGWQPRDAPSAAMRPTTNLVMI